MALWWSVAIAVLLFIVGLLLTSGNRERRLYEELVQFALGDDGDWLYAEDLIWRTDGALKPYILHAVLGNLVSRKIIERDQSGGRSKYRRKNNGNSN